MLHESCIGFRSDSSSKILGVELKIIPIYGARYTIKDCYLENEYDAKGRTIAYNKGDIEGNKIALCYPYEGKPEFKNILLPGNDKNEHPIVNGYTPPELGYLSLCVVDTNKKIVSDILFGLGLPFRRHISFRVLWGLKKISEDEILPEDDQTIKNLLLSLHKKIDKLVYFLEGD